MEKDILDQIKWTKELLVANCPSAARSAILVAAVAFKAYRHNLNDRARKDICEQIKNLENRIF